LSDRQYCSRRRFREQHRNRYRERPFEYLHEFLTM
jgi:hypothetical protein